MIPPDKSTRDDSAPDCVAGLYTAATDTAMWPAALDRLCLKLRARAAWVVSRDREDLQQPVLSGSSTGSIALHANEPTAEGALAGVHIADTTKQAGPTLVLTERRAERSSALIVSRAAGDSQFTAEEVAWFNGLALDFTCAMNAWTQIQTLRVGTVDAASVVTALTRPVGLAYGSGEIIAWNAAAAAVLTRQQIDFQACERDWQSACRQAVRTGSAVMAASGAVRFRLARIRQVQNDAMTLLGVYSTERLVVSLEETTQVSRQQAGRPALSPAEQDVLRLLKLGQSIAQIAVTRGTSISTVRQHIKNLRRKTGRRSMVSLVALSNA